MKLRQKQRKVEDLMNECLERLRMIEMHVCPHEVVTPVRELSPGEWLVECNDCGRPWCAEKAELRTMFGKRLKW